MKLNKQDLEVIAQHPLNWSVNCIVFGIGDVNYFINDSMGERIDLNSGTDKELNLIIRAVNEIKIVGKKNK